MLPPDTYLFRFVKLLYCGWWVLNNHHLKNKTGGCRRKEEPFLLCLSSMQMPADATPQGHHNTGSSWRSRGMSSFTQCTATTATRYPSVSSCKFLLFVGGCWRWRCGQVKPSCLIGEPRQCRQTTRHQGRSSHFHSQQMVIFLLVSPNFHKYGKIFGCFNESFWRKLSILSRRREVESGEQGTPRQMVAVSLRCHFLMFLGILISWFLALDVWLWNKNHLAEIGPHIRSFIGSRARLLSPRCHQTTVLLAGLLLTGASKAWSQGYC